MKAWNWFWNKMNKLTVLLLVVGGIGLNIALIYLIAKPEILENYGYKVYEYKDEFGITSAYTFEVNEKKYLEVVYKDFFIEHEYDLECYITFGKDDAITSEQVIKLEVNPYLDVNSVGNQNNTIYYCEIPKEYYFEEEIYYAYKRLNEENTVYSFTWAKAYSYNETFEIQ